jgi:hypothetical protein
MAALYEKKRDPSPQSQKASPQPTWRRRTIPRLTHRLGVLIETIDAELITSERLAEAAEIEQCVAGVVGG